MLDFRLDIFIDETFENDCLRYEMFWGKIKVLSYEYYRRRKKGIENPFVACGVLLLGKMGFQPIANVRKRLSEEEKIRVAYVFPYISHYKGMRSFVQNYEQYDSKYPYDTHDECNRLKQTLLNATELKRGWMLRYGDLGTPFLTNCWDGSSEKKCIVVTNGSVFSSNITVQEVSDAEINNEMPSATDKEKEFIKGRFSAFYPDIQMRSYIESGGKYIFRTCVAANGKDHVFELLAKSGLGNLADAYLNSGFEGLNLAGTSPAMIFDMPLKLLRNINQLQEENLILTLEERKAMAEAWKRFPKLFEEPLRTIDIMWINYWHEAQVDCLLKRELLDKLPLKETITYLRQIIDKGEMNDYTVFACYENYLMYSLKAGMVFCGGKYPKDLEAEIILIIEEMKLRKEKEAEDAFAKVVNSARYQMHMDGTPGEEFIICAPRSRGELSKAGSTLYNCLSRYAIKILSKECVIGLVYQRKEKNEKKLIGAIEISCNSIVQAKWVCNKTLDKEVRDYIKGFAKRKKLRINTMDILKENFEYEY